VKKGEEIRERRKKKEMKRKVKGAWGNEKERERRNEKIKGGEMQKKKKREN
jgi:hypothetical protein